jgi:excisionase family DNA binding protein
MISTVDQKNRVGRETSQSTTKGITPLLDIHAVAAVLGVTPRHVQRLVTERRIPYVKVGRFVRFDPAELNLWLDEHRVEVHPSPCRGHRGSR